MMMEPFYDAYIKKLDECLLKYIPPRNTWSPIDEALYKPKDLYRIPLKEAEELQLKSIKFTFNYHYINNRFYQGFCKENNITPSSIISREYHQSCKPELPGRVFKYLVTIITKNRNQS